MTLNEARGHCRGGEPIVNTREIARGARQAKRRPLNACETRAKIENDTRNKTPDTRRPRLPSPPPPPPPTSLRSRATLFAPAAKGSLTVLARARAPDSFSFRNNYVFPARRGRYAGLFGRK